MTPQNGRPGWTPSHTPPGRYPERTPPRLSGFPLYCLGCLGLAVLAFVALAGFGMYQARKMMGPPITAATLNAALPPGVPIYPRFTLVESGSRHMKLPIPGAAGRGTPQMVMLTFTCPDPLSTVGPWYQKALAPQGWTGGVSPTQPGQYQLQRGTTTMVLQEAKQPGQQLITMVVASAPSAPPPATSAPPRATFPAPGP